MEQSDRFKNYKDSGLYIGINKLKDIDDMFTVLRNKYSVQYITFDISEENDIERYLEKHTACRLLGYRAACCTLGYKQEFKQVYANYFKRRNEL